MVKNIETLLMCLQRCGVLDEYHCKHLTTWLGHASLCGYIRDITPHEVDVLASAIETEVQDTSSPLGRTGLSEELLTCTVHMIIDADLEDLERTNERLLIQVFKVVAVVAKRSSNTLN